MSGVAGRSADLIDLDEKGIAVAVLVEGFDLLEISRFLAFLP